MPRAINKFSSRAVEFLRQGGRHSDGGGLYLFISDARRRWIFRYTRAGKTVEMGLGAAGKGGVTLAEARVLRRRSPPPPRYRRRSAQSETFNLAARAAAARPTFGEIADEYVEVMRPSWRNAKHAWQWAATLRSCSAIRHLQIDQVDTEGILAVLRDSARFRVIQDPFYPAAKPLGAVSGFSCHMGRDRVENPARWRGHLDQLLPKRRRLTRGHRPALPYRTLPSFQASRVYDFNGGAVGRGPLGGMERNRFR